MLQKRCGNFEDSHLWATKANTNFSYKYLDEVLKSFVVLLQLFEKADCFVVTAAELPVDLLHPLPVVIRELRTCMYIVADSNNIQQR